MGESAVSSHSCEMKGIIALLVSFSLLPLFSSSKKIVSFDERNDVGYKEIKKEEQQTERGIQFASLRQVRAGNKKLSKRSSRITEKKRNTKSKGNKNSINKNKRKSNKMKWKIVKRMSSIGENEIDSPQNSRREKKKIKTQKKSNYKKNFSSKKSEEKNKSEKSKKKGKPKITSSKKKNNKG